MSFQRFHFVNIASSSRGDQ